MDIVRNYQRRKRLGLKEFDQVEEDKDNTTIEEICDLYRREEYENVKSERLADLSGGVQRLMENVSELFSKLNGKRREVQALQDSNSKLEQSLYAMMDENDTLRDTEAKTRNRVSELIATNQQLGTDVRRLKQLEAVDNKSDYILNCVLSEEEPTMVPLPNLQLHGSEEVEAWDHFCKLLMDLRQPHQCQTDIYDTRIPRCDKCLEDLKNVDFFAQEVGRRDADQFLSLSLPPPTLESNMSSPLHPDTEWSDMRPNASRHSSGSERIVERSVPERRSFVDAAAFGSSFPFVSKRGAKVIPLPPPLSPTTSVKAPRYLPPPREVVTPGFIPRSSANMPKPGGITTIPPSGTVAPGFIPRSSVNVPKPGGTTVPPSGPAAPIFSPSISANAPRTREIPLPTSGPASSSYTPSTSANAPRTGEIPLPPSGPASSSYNPSTYANVPKSGGTINLPLSGTVPPNFAPSTHAANAPRPGGIPLPPSGPASSSYTPSSSTNLPRPGKIPVPSPSGALPPNFTPSTHAANVPRPGGIPLPPSSLGPPIFSSPTMSTNMPHILGGAP